METDELMGSSVEQNLARLLHNAVREAGTCSGYALDAETAGDERLAGFFREAQKTYTDLAERAGEMLGDGGEEQPPAEVRPDRVPMEGDPGDVTSSQNGA